MYVILVGRPGIGKGLAIREVSSALSYWKLKDAIKYNSKLDEVQKLTADSVLQSDIENAQSNELQASNKKNAIVDPLLIPLAADATTYEALVSAVASSYRRINYIAFDEKIQQNVLKIYGHSSLCFSLQELSSLLRARTNDTVNYLLGLYDCPEDYTYDTKTKGKDRVRRGCLNLLAGTTPSFMRSIFDSKLVDEGLSSRTFFIFSEKNRKSVFFIPELTDEQKQHKKELYDHIRQLTGLYGKARVSQQTWDFLADWWDNYEKSLDNRSNNSVKLMPYYSRKNIHVMKVAMAIHFAESLDMTIPQLCFEQAINVLEKEEKNMHLALMMDGTNPISKISNKIIDYLKLGRKNFVDIYIHVFEMGTKQQIEEALSFLTDTGKATLESEVDEITTRSVQYWRLKE